MNTFSRAEELPNGHALLRDAKVVVAASVPFALAGFGILELPIRWASQSRFSGAQIGLTLAAYGFGYGLAQIPSGLLTDRLGAAATLRLSLLGGVLGWPLTLTPWWPMVGLGRVVYGFGIGLSFSAGLMLLRSHIGETRHARAVAAFASAWGVGLVAASVLGRSEVASGTLIAVAVGVGFVLLAIHSASEVRVVLSAAPGVRSVRGHWSDAAKVMLFVSPAGILGQVSLVTWGPRAAGARPGASVAAVGLVVAAGLALGSFIGSAISASARSNTIVALSPILTGALLVVFAFVGASQPLRLLAIGAASTVSLINFAPGMARIFRETPNEFQAATTAIINQVGWLGSAVGPIVLGLGAHRTQPSRFAWSAVAALIAAAGVAAYTLDHGSTKHRKKERTS
jgi:MFS family permease